MRQRREAGLGSTPPRRRTPGPTFADQAGQLRRETAPRIQTAQDIAAEAAALLGEMHELVRRQDAVIEQQNYELDLLNVVGQAAYALAYGAGTMRELKEALAVCYNQGTTARAA